MRGKKGKKKSISTGCLNMRERGREKRKKNLNFSLRSTEFHQSEFIGLRTKVHLLDKGYVWVPKI